MLLRGTRTTAPVQLRGDVDLQLNLVRTELELVQLFDRLLADVIQLGDRVIQAGDLLLLQVFRALCHYLRQQLGFQASPGPSR